MIKYKFTLLLIVVMILPALHAQPPVPSKANPGRIEAENRILVQLVHELRDRLSSHRPRWGVPAKPAVPGEYDYRYRHPAGDWQVDRMIVTRSMIVEGIPDDGTQWSGPIPVPSEPEGAGK